MVAPVFLVCLALAGVLAALLVPGASDLLLIALAVLAAALIVLLRAWRRLPAGWRGRADQRRSGRLVGRATGRYVVVDGSNVMHWKGNAPDLQPLLDVIAELSRRGITPGVVFDANAGYRLEGRYRHDHAMALKLGLPEAQVMVVPKGEVADAWILAAARDLGAKVVTNDRYRDWAAAHPEVTEPGHLIRGGYRDGRLWLDG